MRRMRFISILVVLLISLGLVTVSLAAFGSINNLEKSRFASGALEKSEIAFDTIIRRTMSIDDGLVSHYPFNGNANDESGNGNDGTVVGAVLTTDRFGNTDSAFSFDGVDNYVEIPDDSIFDFNDKGFSLALWIKTDATTGKQSERDDIVGKGDATIEGFTISMRYNYPTFFIGDYLSCGGATELNDGIWHHLSGTRDDANNVVLYVDGKTESRCTNNENVNTNYSMFFGKHGTMNASYYDGVIDDIYIYNRALSANEVEMLYYIGTDKTFLPLITNVSTCSPLFTDDFSDPGSGWPISDDGNIRYEYLAGEYRIMVRNTSWWTGARPGFKASDYVVAVDVRNAGNYGSYGLLFGGSDDWSQFYGFDIDPDGYYWLWKKDGDDWTTFDEGYSTHINTGTATNRIKVKRDGSEISIYANGQFITSVIDSSLLGERHLGLITFAYDQPGVDARFDNFAVYPVECSQAAGQSNVSRRVPYLEIIGSINSGQMINHHDSMKR